MTETTKAPKESWVEMTELILPQHTNSLGTVFGGTIMAWVDIAAATCAMRHCRRQVVTASIDALHFLAPVKLGWIVSIRASINYTSRSSCEVGVRIASEDPRTGDKAHTASAYVTMVALNELGDPIEIPQIKPETDKEKERFEAAKLRREDRLKLKTTIKNRRKT